MLQKLEIAVKKGGMTDQQHLYFNQLFEKTYSVAKLGRMCTYFWMGKITQVDFFPIVPMKMIVPTEILLTFVLMRFVKKRLRKRSNNVILIVSCDSAITDVEAIYVFLSIQLTLKLKHVFFFIFIIFKQIYKSTLK